MRLGVGYRSNFIDLDLDDMLKLEKASAKSEIVVSNKADRQKTFLVCIVLIIAIYVLPPSVLIEVLTVFCYIIVSSDFLPLRKSGVRHFDRRTGRRDIGACTLLVISFAMDSPAHGEATCWRFLRKSQ